MSTPTIDPRKLASTLDDVLAAATSGDDRVPGVVAGVTTDTDDVYLGSAGLRSIDDDSTPMTTDSVFAIFSATKAITATVALQLVEQGRLDLDAPAREYVPLLGLVRVIEGFEDNGEPRLRAPETDLTTRQLLTHTAGFGYDFFNETYARLSRDGRMPDISTATMDALTTPLLFDPGTAWEYGSNIDWVGLVIEAVTGARLGDVMSEDLFSPLGMSDTGFALSTDQRERRAVMHRRKPDGTLTPNHRFAQPTDPEVQMGGQGLYSTVRDYLAFCRIWLRGGTSDSGEQILAPETVAEATRGQLGDLSVRMLPGVKPALSHDIEFFPGLPKSWSLAFMVNDADAPTGRRAGSSAWAGLANLYYWIDPATGVAGFWATQLFPFGDPPALRHYLDFETATYQAIR
ncbi:serine hydrolase domain-containing protein [Gordonia sp. NPDC003424]